MKVVVAPSILSADFSHLSDECERVLTESNSNDTDRSWLHIDVMDGFFVPNISIGFPAIRSLNKYFQSKEMDGKGLKPFFDVHIMVCEPFKWIDELQACGADNVTFHIESFSCVNDILACARHVFNKSMKASLAIRPSTKVDSYFFECLDMIAENQDLFFMFLVMTVEPGFGGQSFIASCLERTRLIRQRLPDINIQVDGGINFDTAKQSIAAGANVLVAGSFIFSSPNAKDTIRRLQEE